MSDEGHKTPTQGGAPELEQEAGNPWTTGPSPAEPASRSRTARRAGQPDAALIRRVRWRLVAWSAGTTLLVLLALGWALYIAVSGSLDSSGRHTLDTRADQVRRFLLETRVLPPSGAPIGLSIGGPASGTFAFIVGPDEQALGPANLGLEGLPDEAALAVARQGGTDVRNLTVEGFPLRVLTEPVSRGTSTYIIQVVQDITGEQRLLDVMLTVLLAGGFIAVIGALIVGAIYAGRALVPIRESLRRQREFAADASHEFRTPLAVIRSSVEYMERHKDEPAGNVGDALHDIRDEVEHLTALVGDLLLLARTDSGVVELEPMPVDLAEVAEEAVRSVGSLADARQVRLMLDPAPTPLVGDPLRLRQLVTILADNAIAHSPAGSTVTIHVGPSADGANLAVDDEGPGVREEDMAHVFDRFWRARGEPAGGTGLGLAIAAWIAERHGGSIGVTNRPDRGARFTVRLPTAVLKTARAV
jgi:signal transduction histidine kinase